MYQSELTTSRGGPTLAAMGHPSNSRRSERERIYLPATCRTSTGRKGPVMITDLTAQGCRLFLRALPVTVGLRIRVKPDTFEPLSGVVRWVRRGDAGVEFDKPLYGPVAEHIQAQFRAS